MTRGEVLEHAEGWRWVRAQAAPVYNLVSAVLAGVFIAQDWRHPIWFLWLACLVIFSNGTVRSLMKLVVIVQVKAEWEDIQSGNRKPPGYYDDLIDHLEQRKADKPIAGSGR